MPIPFLDLISTYHELEAEIDSAISRILNSGTYILGDELCLFESEWATFCQAPYSVGVANGFDALKLSLLALGIGTGDHVLVPANTFIATWLAVSSVGAIPIPVEPNINTYNIDASLIPAAITPQTKAIIVVHLYGQPADLDGIAHVAKHHGIYLIEDAAQAHCAFYKGQPIGSHSDVVTWSFYPGKNLGAFGDAGAITTKNPHIYNMIKLLRNYGSNVKYSHLVQGVNSRLDPLQAAVLRIKLRHLPAWTERRRQVAMHYYQSLQCLPFILPLVPEFALPSWHLYVIRSSHRDQLQRYLADSGIETIIHYPTPPHLQPAYHSLHTAPLKLPIAEKLASEVLSLPIGPHLSVADQNLIITTMKSFASEHI